METHRGGRRQSFNTTCRTSGAPSTGAAIARPRLFGTTRSSPDPPAREPVSHVRRHGRHNLLQTGRFRHNLLGGRRSHPQADLQLLPLSTAFRRLSNGGYLRRLSHLSNHSKTQDRDRQDRNPQKCWIYPQKCTTPPSLSGPRVPRAVSADAPRSPPPVGLLLAHLLLHEGFSLGLVVGRPSVIMDTDRCFPCQLATVRCNPSSSENSGR